MAANQRETVMIGTHDKFFDLEHPIILRRCARRERGFPPRLRTVGRSGLLDGGYGDRLRVEQASCCATDQ